jgi:hypothetical protein
MKSLIGFGNAENAISVNKCLQHAAQPQSIALRPRADKLGIDVEDLLAML